MSNFLHFESCPRCGSRDNLAVYSENKWCFGCSYYETTKNLETISKRFNASKSNRVCNGITFEQSLARDHLKWLLKYNLTTEEMSQFKSSHEREIKGENRGCNLLVLLFSNNYWLARNFDAGGVKYMSSGVKPYKEFGSNSEVLVFVEDVISAVKVGRVATAVPMLSAKVANDWWQQAKRFKRVIIHGDFDKASENVIQSRRASEIVGFKVENIITEKDPKCFSTNELKDLYNIT